MSFLYSDKNFLKTIFKLSEPIGAVEQVRQNKSPGVLNEDLSLLSDPKVDTKIINKIFSNLLSTSGVNKINFGTNTEQMNAFNNFCKTVNIDNLNSLTNFVTSVNKAGVQFQNKPIVRKVEEGGCPIGYYKYDNQNCVNILGLKELLVYFKNSEKYLGTSDKSENRLFKVEIDYLYRECEKLEGFKDAGFTQVEMVASFGNPIDLSKPIKENPGNIYLLTSDMESGNSLGQWLKDKKITFKNAKTSNEICEFAQYLYQQLDAKYKPLCEKLIRSISGCQIPGAAGEVKEKTETGVGAGAGVSAGAQAARQEIENIFAAGGPLYFDYINFDIIERFLTNCKIFFPTSDIASRSIATISELESKISAFREQLFRDQTLMLSTSDPNLIFDFETKHGRYMPYQKEVVINFTNQLANAISRMPNIVHIALISLRYNPEDAGSKGATILNGQRSNSIRNTTALNSMSTKIRYSQ